MGDAVNSFAVGKFSLSFNKANTALVKKNSNVTPIENVN